MLITLLLIDVVGRTNKRLFLTTSLNFKASSDTDTPLKNMEPTRLYFTAEKVCIGSYDEVHKYEEETGQSYWASDFFQLPPKFKYVGQTLDAIQSAVRSAQQSRSDVRRNERGIVTWIKPK